MKDSFDSDEFKTQFTEEQTELVVDPKHPGKDDADYMERRKYYFDLCREWRLEEKGVPEIEYSQNEKGVWGPIARQLDTVHKTKACAIYNKGREVLSIPSNELPKMSDLSRQLERVSGFSVTPAEGLLPFREFFRYIAEGKMPCTQYLRHHSQPQYTPEPDMVHDVIGHIPVLADKDYVEFVKMIGRATRLANDEQLEAFNRLYWYTIEFSLIREQKDIKVFGAGILSSYGEMDFCFSDEVERREFSMDEIVALDYDPTEMQRRLFIIPSMEALTYETRQLIHRFGLGETL